MRFGRRVKHRFQDSETAGHSGSNAVGVVAGVERDAILEFNRPATGMNQGASYEVDPTQELLGALGHFQQHLADAQAGALQEEWSDDAMNQLISGVEVALGQNWREVVEALTDTGRVLHTYETAGRADECVPFLCDAYEILCLMAGDLIVDTIRQGVKDKWHNRFIIAVAEIEVAGLTLIDDEVEPDPPAPRGLFVTSTPFDPPGDGGIPIWDKPAASHPELPTLDELPPLESLLDPGLDGSTAMPTNDPTTPASEPVSGPTADAANEHMYAEISSSDNPRVPRSPVEPSPDDVVLDSTVDTPPGPSKFVVDVLDRTCDQLSVINRASSKERALLIERMIGGVAALRREADHMGSPAAMDLCDSMEAVFNAALSREGELGERFIDLGYAFSGVYMEAVQDGHAVSAEEWRTETKGLIASWAVTPMAEWPGPAARDLDPETGARTHQDLECPAQTVGPFGMESDASASFAEVSVTAADFPALDEFAAVAASGESGQPVVDVPVPEDGRAPSRGYLDAAQQAALDGDAAGAKHYALLAAASIAREEAARAELRLRGTEVRLRQGLQAAEGAREDVRGAEQAVSHVAGEVVSGAEALHAAGECTASCALDAEAAQGRVGEIDEQIRALQARREETLAGVDAASARLEAARAGEGMAEQALAGFRSIEQESRLRLERSRQGVKEHQRAIAEIEAEMESTRESLARHKRSVADIELTIHHVADARPGEGADPQLF